MRLMLSLIFIELYIAGFCSLLFVLIKLCEAWRKYRFKTPVKFDSSESLPSVSVCISARNEMHAMTECLESVLASDYPKLEIIVLDDDSSDNTSHIIRAFAHAGVRFVEGSSLPEEWLGRNFSLQALADEASGKLVLFLDVDTRLEGNSISDMVKFMQVEKIKMLSVVPQRYDSFRSSAWLSTLRYFWEIVLSSRRMPGVSSSAWLIDRHTLTDDLDGFRKWSNEVQPESHIASELVKTDEYAFRISTPALGLGYEKKWSSQVEASRRLLLPRFGNSITSLLLAASLAAYVVLSQVILALSIVEQSWPLAVLQIILGLMALMIFTIYYKLILVRGWIIGVIVSPYIVWQELILLVASAIGYKRGTITWKGRPVRRSNIKRSLL